jgi:hypothetical protein
MEENTNLVTDVTENVEQTTEETPRTYTEEEFNERVNLKVKEVMGSKLARKEAKIRKEMEAKYGETINILKAGTGKESVDDINSTLKEFYSDQGIELESPKPTYSASDLKVLAQADADYFISGGIEDVIEEADRLNELGADGMTEREKALFVKLTDHIRDTKTRQKLDELGVSKDVYESDDFKQFAKMFNASTPIETVHKIYADSHPQKEIKTMGSMKSVVSHDDGIKDYYTPEEAKKFTVEDFNRNPKLLERVEESMRQWGR